jgi:plasmid maintenance system antidote protein VapI
MNDLAEISTTKLNVAKRRARLKAVEMLQLAYAEAHEKYGLTRAQFADRIGMKPSQLSRILSGAQNVSVEMVEGVLRAFESRLVMGYEPLDSLVVKPSNRYPRQVANPITFIDRATSVGRAGKGRYTTSRMKW